MVNTLILVQACTPAAWAPGNQLIPEPVFLIRSLWGTFPQQPRSRPGQPGSFSWTTRRWSWCPEICSLRSCRLGRTCKKFTLKIWPYFDNFLCFYCEIFCTVLDNQNPLSKYPASAMQSFQHSKIRKASHTAYLKASVWFFLINSFCWSGETQKCLNYMKTVHKNIV